jgi:hypothetical protein
MVRDDPGRDGIRSAYGQSRRRRERGAERRSRCKRDTNGECHSHPHHHANCFGHAGDQERSLQQSDRGAEPNTVRGGNAGYDRARR